MWILGLKGLKDDVKAKSLHYNQQIVAGNIQLSSLVIGRMPKRCAIRQFGFSSTDKYCRK